MILFHINLKNDCKQFKNLNNLFSKFSYSCNKNTFILVNLKKKRPIFISKYNNTVLLSSNYLLKDKISYQFISRNFWNEFINKYWQETLFISSNNILSDYYVNQLKSSGLLINKGNYYKKFLLNFSRDLINGKIQVLFYKKKMQISLVKINNNKYIKYVWRKGFNWYIYNLFSKYLLIKNYISRQESNSIVKNIEINTLPLFAVMNQNNQLIIAESPDAIPTQKYLFKSLKIFYNIIASKKNYIGLLFINPNDALEYKNYSMYKYLYQTNNLLNLFISKLNLYYKLLYSSVYNTEFKLIPDLKEISNIIYKYQYYKNISFDKYQKYGKNYFQGQPIYIIKPVTVKNLYTRQKYKLNYFYNVNKNSNSKNYKAVFLNYDTALLAWHKFRKDHFYYKIPIKPYFYVSNLENFIKLKMYKKNNANYIFIPSSETYRFIRPKININQKLSIIKILEKKSLYINNLCKRLIWSLISRYPI